MRFRWFSAERAGGFSYPFDDGAGLAFGSAIATINPARRSGAGRIGAAAAAIGTLSLVFLVAFCGEVRAQFLALPDGALSGVFGGPSKSVPSPGTGTAKPVSRTKPGTGTKPRPSKVAQVRGKVARSKVKRSKTPDAARSAGEPQTSGPYERLNRNTTTIIADDPDGTLMRLAYDMARVLDAGNDVRVLPIVGKGAEQNVSDLLHLKGIDIGLTQSDVLAELKRSGQLGAGLEDRLAYIAKICNLEVHMVSRRDVATIGDLDGKPVNFGPDGSGSQFSARAIFKAMGVEPVEVNETVEEARLKLARGEIAAYVVVDGKPSKRVAQIATGEAKLLGLPYPAGLERDYLPARFSHDDYPDLIAKGEAVDTVALGAVLAVYNWPAGHERHERVGRLVNLFFSSSADFQKPPRHPKWREANLAAPFSGWVRFKPAQDWLDRRLAESGSVSGSGKPVAVEPQRARELAEKVAPGNPAEQQRLFELFVGKKTVPQ